MVACTSQSLEYLPASQLLRYLHTCDVTCGRWSGAADAQTPSAQILLTLPEASSPQPCCRMYMQWTVRNTVGSTLHCYILYANCIHYMCNEYCVLKYL